MKRNRVAGNGRQVQNVCFGYVRVSTVRQDLERQKLDIHEYANREGWQISRIIEATVSSRKSQAARGITELKTAAEAGAVNTVIFSELSRMGRSVGEIARLIDYLVTEHGVTLCFVKERMRLTPQPHDMETLIKLTIFSLLAELEHYLIVERTTSGLAARRAAGVRLGRPPLKSKLDPKEDEIRGMLVMGVKQKFIARKVGCTECTLSNWLKRKRQDWNAAQPQAGR